MLTRNLHDVFGENDPARRRAATDEIFTEDCVFYESRGIHRGRDAIDFISVQRLGGDNPGEMASRGDDSSDVTVLEYCL